MTAINPFRQLIADLSSIPTELTFTVQRPADPAKCLEHVWLLHLRANGRTEVVRWKSKEGLSLQSEPNGSANIDIRWMPSWDVASILARRLGAPLQPQRGHGASTLKPLPLNALRRRLLPLARLAGGNVYGWVDPTADPHLALRMVDGLHDDFPEIQGVLDGLEAAVNLGYWQMEEVGHDNGERALVPGPTPPTELPPLPEVTDAEA